MILTQNRHVNRHADLGQTEVKTGYERGTNMEKYTEAVQVQIRPARRDEAERLAEIEAICFPAAEAAGLKDFNERMDVFLENFLVAEVDGKVIGFVNGCTTDRPVLGDELYHDAALHKKDGDIQTVFGLNVLPEYRHRGIAHRLLGSLVELSRKRGKRQ